MKTKIPRHLHFISNQNKNIELKHIYTQMKLKEIIVVII